MSASLRIRYTAMPPINSRGYIHSSDGYIDWLLDTREKMIDLVTANPSLAAKALSHPPLCQLTDEVRSSAKELYNRGELVQLIDLLIGATADEAIQSLVRDGLVSAESLDDEQHK